MTIGGVPTVAELRDLVAAKDFETNKLDQAWGAYGPAWIAKDSVGYVNWTNDWDSLKTRYASARSMAERWLTGWQAALTPTPDNLTPALAPWNAIMSALQKTAGSVSPGDLQDLYNRFAASGAPPVSFAGMPQPSPGSDADMNLLQSLGGSPASKASCNGFCIPGIGGDCILCIPRWIPVAIGAAMIFAFFGPTIAAMIVPIFVASRR